MSEIIRPALVLFLVTVIAAACLGAVYGLTKEPIERQQQITRDNALRELLPAAERFDEEPALVEAAGNRMIQSCYVGVSAAAADGTVGYVIGVSSTGYAGAIDMMVAIDNDGVIGGIKIVSHSETPGLGANAKNPVFTDQFIGKSGKLDVVKGGAADDEIDAITSATITSVAVVDGVNAATTFYQEYLAR